MSDVRVVSRETYDEMVRLLAEASAAREAARGPGLTLARKLELLGKARAQTEQARVIGNREPT